MSTVYIRLTIQEPGIWQRAPQFERLIARASGSVRVNDWRADAFGAVAAPGMLVPPIAAVALLAASDTGPAAWVCLATPVHFVAGLSNVTLADDGILDLEPAEALALAADFNRDFGRSGDVRMVANRTGALLCVFESTLDVATCDPADVVGGDVFAFQPCGADAPRLRRLMSEMEMWLFENAANRRRSADGLSPITALWLWGGGPVLREMVAVHGWTAGRDPLFGALAALDPGGAVSEFPAGEGATGRKRSSGGVAVVADHPGSPTWPDVQQRWLVPAVAALHAARIGRLELSAGQHRFTFEKGHGWRFWRRSRPWWETFDIAAEGSESNGGE